MFLSELRGCSVSFAANTPLAVGPASRTPVRWPNVRVGVIKFGASLATARRRTGVTRPNDQPSPDRELNATLPCARRPVRAARPGRISSCDAPHIVGQHREAQEPGLGVRGRGDAPCVGASRPPGAGRELGPGRRDVTARSGSKQILQWLRSARQAARGTGQGWRGRRVLRASARARVMAYSARSRCFPSIAALARCPPMPPGRNARAGPPRAGRLRSGRRCAGPPCWRSARARTAPKSFC